MGSFIIARPSETAHFFQWVFINNHRVDETLYEGSIHELAEKIQHTSLWLIIPPPHVLFIPIALPKVKKSLIPQALNFTIKDQLATSLEKLHICTGENSVATLDKEQLASITHPLREKKLSIQHIYPSTLCQPIQKDHWHIVVEKHMASVRTGITSGFSCDLHNLNAIINSHLEESVKNNSAPQHITIQLTDTHHPTDFFDFNAPGKNIQPKITVQKLEEKNILILLAKNILENKPPIDFKKHLTKGNENRCLSGYYRLITLMVCLLLSLALFDKWLEYSYFYKKQATANGYLSQIGLGDASKTQLKQMQIAINHSKHNDIFNVLFSKVKACLYLHPSIIVNSINFESPILSLTFSSKNKNATEKFIVSLSHSVTIKTKFIEKGENYWKGSLTITEKE